MVNKTQNHTVLIDRLMNLFIKSGGIIVILAVLGIFFFILSQVLPLFQKAKVTFVEKIPLPAQNYQVLGTDEWGELPFFLTQDGTLTFFDVHTKQIKNTNKIKSLNQFSAFSYQPKTKTIVLATDNHQFKLVTIHYEALFENQRRVLRPEFQESDFFSLGDSRYRVMATSVSVASRLQVASLAVHNQKHLVSLASLDKTQTLMGDSQIQLQKVIDLTPFITEEPQDLFLNDSGESLIVTTKLGGVYYFEITDQNVALKQFFKPFKNLEIKNIATAGFLFGGVSIIFTNTTGENRVFSLYRQEGQEIRLFGQTKEFPSLGETPHLSLANQRNKSFLLAAKNRTSLRYSTTSAIRWEDTLPFEPTLAVINEKNTKMFFVDTQNTLQVYDLNDPHPEAGWATFFGKIWYEGFSQPEFFWQSTGGSDSFETKLSLVPLLIGTFKGTLYAMLFSVPIGLMAAIYTSQFLSQRMRAVVKPTMEIMASFPSVILGFIGALWLAPLLEDKVPGFFCMLILSPLVLYAFGYAWSYAESKKLIKGKVGFEFLISMPLLLVVAWLSFELGPVVEKVFFTVTDPHSQKTVADFRLWWGEFAGKNFEQRNALIVGFVMGFAVIPIIFTIAEDALSSVPLGIKSASLALGASRWQTTKWVVLPTAAAGIFSALMVGLGRAVGETMIVVMATGNTPIMDWDMFSGMRTLSANLAVELPEAPHFSTLYRTLFFGALLLFLMTFVLNTLAEILRQHFREKYKI